MACIAGWHRLSSTEAGYDQTSCGSQMQHKQYQASWDEKLKQTCSKNILAVNILKASIHQHAITAVRL